MTWLVRKIDDENIMFKDDFKNKNAFILYFNFKTDVSSVVSYRCLTLTLATF